MSSRSLKSVRNLMDRIETHSDTQLPKIGATVACLSMRATAAIHATHEQAGLRQIHAKCLKPTFPDCAALKFSFINALLQCNRTSLQVWLDVHLEDVSRLGAPVSTQAKLPRRR